MEKDFSDLADFLHSKCSCCLLKVFVYVLVHKLVRRQLRLRYQTQSQLGMQVVSLFLPVTA